MMKSISNFQFPISNFRKPIFFVFLFFLLLFLFPISYFLSPTSSVLAHDSGKNNDFWTPGDRIVPCINDCNKCELLHLSRHVIDFLMVAATPILATFFLIWAGVLIMMGGANPGMLSSGKRIFKDTIIGVLIVMLSWLIVNTLIKSLAKDAIPEGACINNVCTNGVGACNVDDDCGTATYNWWQFSCSQAPGSGNPPGVQNPPLPSCSPACTGGQVCVINGNQASCQTPPAYNCGPCDPLTNAGCAPSQACVLDIRTNVCSCQ